MSNTCENILKVPAKLWVKRENHQGFIRFKQQAFKILNSWLHLVRLVCPMALPKYLSPNWLSNSVTEPLSDPVWRLIIWLVDGLMSILQSSKLSNLMMKGLVGTSDYIDYFYNSLQQLIAHLCDWAWMTFPHTKSSNRRGKMGANQSSLETLQSFCTEQTTASKRCMIENDMDR